MVTCMLKCFLFVNVDGSLSLSFSFQKHVYPPAATAASK